MKLPFSSRAPLRITFGVAIGFIGFFSILPAGAIFVLAFTDIRGVPFLPVNWIGLENFVRFFSPAQWSTNLPALLNTLEFAFVTTIVGNVLALLIAVVFNRPLRGLAFFRGIVFLPTVLGVTIIGMVWSLIFNPGGGPAQTVWSWFGASSAFLGDTNLAFPIVMFVQIWAGAGVAMVIYLAGLQNIPAHFYEAAEVDGASRWQRLRFVTIPLLAPSITANVVLSIIGSLQSFQLAYVLTGARNPATALLGTVIFSQGFSGGTSSVQISQGYASAVSVVQFFIVGVLALGALTYLRRREVQL